MNRDNLSCSNVANRDVFFFVRNGPYKRQCENSLSERILICSRHFLTSLSRVVFVWATSEWIYPPNSARRSPMARGGKKKKKGLGIRRQKKQGHPRPSEPFLFLHNLFNKTTFLGFSEKKRFQILFCFFQLRRANDVLLRKAPTINK